MKKPVTMTAKAIALKTFGGLTKEYYLRNFIFGLAVSIFLFFTFRSAQVPTYPYIFIIISLFLYPYSRFVYESVINFILGENAFFTATGLFILVKTFTILLCYMFAIFIAPIGLLYLYLHHTKQEKKANAETK